MEHPLVNWSALPAGPLWLVPPGLTDAESAQLKRLRAEIRAAADEVWVFSSGTSSVGTLKCLGLTRAAILDSAAAVNRHLGATAADRWLLAIPTYHVGGFAIAARAHLTGAAVDVSPPWSALNFRNACARRGTSLSSLVPTQVHDLVAANLNAPAGLRAIVVGGAALNPALYARARALGWPVLPSYGLTETASQIATAPLDHAGPGCPDLKILSHAAIEIRDGRLRVRASSLAHRRATIDPAGRVTLDDPRGADGWLITDDLAEWTADGGLRVIGRRDDVVKILGVLVAVPRVEAEVSDALGGTSDVIVLSTADARRGADLIAVTDRAGSLATMDAALAAYNAAAAGPRRVERLCWVPRLPRTALGKVRRAALREVLGLVPTQ